MAVVSRERRSLVELIQRPAPFGPLAARRVHTLRPEEIHPVVRIAHRIRGGLAIPERIIFDHELVLIVAGAGEWTLGGDARRFRPHDLLFVPPFVPHSFCPDRGGTPEHIAVHFDFSAGCPGPGRGLDRRRPYRIRFPHGLGIPGHRRLFAGHRIERTLNAVVAAHRSGGVLGGAQAAVHLAGALLALLAEPAGSRREPAAVRHQLRVQSVVDHMAGNLARPLDHADLERISGLSPSRLQALFREVTGHAPLDYLRRMRVEEARRLLADHRLSVKEVGALTGFRDTSAFSKVFRRVDGLSPAHYRDALLTGGQEK
jgi:AraC-like DNA-binding protein